MPDDAPPKQEAAEARAARKAASRAHSQAGEEPSLAGMDAVAAEGHPEVSSAPPPSQQRRYSTRSAVCGTAAGEEEGEHPAPAAGPSALPAATPEPAPLAERRMSLRRLRTPMQMAHLPAADENAATPAAALPVAQDASPQLAESPSCMAADAAASGGPAYAFRSSTLKARQSVGTPLAGGAVATPTAGAASGKKGRQGPQLSPTEQGIRASLRRSARKSKGSGAGEQ